MDIHVIIAIITAVAVFVGPIAGARLGVKLSRHYATHDEVRRNQLDVFRALMATRVDTTAPSHVHALNRIDLEFYGKHSGDRAVTEAWRVYCDHLNSPRENWSPDQYLRWNEKKPELLLDLMHKMARRVGYEFDSSYLRNYCYSPQVYQDIENDNFEIRKGMADVLRGNRAIPMAITNFPPQENKQE